VDCIVSVLSWANLAIRQYHLEGITSGSDTSSLYARAHQSNIINKHLLEQTLKQMCNIVHI
jgi:hypothetical protein